MDNLELPADLVNVTPAESALRALLRAKKYSRIEIHLKNGAVTCIYADEEISPATTSVETIIHSKAFQTITITEHGGNLVRIKRTIPIKI